MTKKKNHKAAYEKEGTFKARLTVVAEMLAEGGLPECYGYHGTRNINQGSNFDEVSENISQLIRCNKCDADTPQVYKTCLNSSKLRTLATVWKDI